MIIRGATEQQIRDAAAETGVLLRYIERKGKGFQMTLAPDVKRKPAKHGYGKILPETQYQRKGFWSQHRINAVCWHGYRDFMRGLYKKAPNAIIITMMARYNFTQDFEKKFEATGGRNIGSIMHPMLARDACFCDEG